MNATVELIKKSAVEVEGSGLAICLRIAVNKRFFSKNSFSTNKIFF